MANSPEVFRETMTRFETAFTVGLIATVDPAGCTLNDRSGDILAQWPDFDQFPVRDGEEVVGALQRATAEPTKLVSEQRSNIALKGSILVAEDEPLERLIPAFVKQPFFLVIRGRGIDALVTQSDLVKLPVQLLALTLTTHLEQVMAQAIRGRFGESEEWVQHLDNYSRKRLLGSQERLRAERANPDLLDLSYFPDKAMVVGNALQPGDRFSGDMEELRLLRNDLSHPKDFIGDDDGLEVFVRRLGLTRHWIDRLSHGASDQPG